MRAKTFVFLHSAFRTTCVCFEDTRDFENTHGFEATRSQVLSQAGCCAGMSTPTRTQRKRSRLLLDEQVAVALAEHSAIMQLSAGRSQSLWQLR